MTQETFKNLVATKFEAINTTELVATIKQIIFNTNEGIDTMVEVILEILESRMTEGEFVELCNNL